MKKVFSVVMIFNILFAGGGFAKLDVKAEPLQESLTFLSAADAPHWIFAQTDTSAMQNQVGQEAYLKASNTGLDDHFGFSVALSGNTLVVGAPEEDSDAVGVNGDQSNDEATNSGAVYVFVYDGMGWVQQAYLKASNAESLDAFGTSVAISGDTIVVGAPMESSSAMGVNGDQNNNGGPGSGAAYVFVRSGTTWTQQAYLKASNTGWQDGFGTSVAVSGDTIVVGAQYEESNATGVNGNQDNDLASSSGAAYVFLRSGTTWAQQAYLKASNTDVGDYFGRAIAISGDTIVVGAYAEDSSAVGVNGDQGNEGGDLDYDSGAAYVFIRQSGVWSQQAYLKASNTDFVDHFGTSVAVSGDTVVVGAPFEDSNAIGVNGNQNDESAPSAGAAYVFIRQSGVWSQQAYLKASNTSLNDAFGSSVAASGNTIVVGAESEDSNAAGVDNEKTNSGAAYVFVQQGTDWGQQAYLKASNPDVHDYFGSSAAVDLELLAVGAYFEDSSATGVNGNQNDNLMDDSGSVYVFDMNEFPYSQYISLIVNE